MTVNAELQVTTGSYLAGKGFLTEAEGDQPGSLAALREDALQMGFQPLVYGNMKGYLNHDPSPEDMAYWANRQGISVDQTTSFTDGTKVQIEQVIIGNGLGATITRQGMEGLASTNLDDSASLLGMMAERVGQPIVDYVIPSGYPAGGVFLVGRHDEDQARAIEYFKLGRGPFYTLVRPFHLCSLEVGKTVRRVLSGGGVLLNNSTEPTLGVAAIAKRAMKPGELIERLRHAAHVARLDMLDAVAQHHPVDRRAVGLGAGLARFPDHFGVKARAGDLVAFGIDPANKVEVDEAVVDRGHQRIGAGDRDPGQRVVAPGVSMMRKSLSCDSASNCCSKRASALSSSTAKRGVGRSRPSLFDARGRRLDQRGREDGRYRWAGAR